MNDKMCEKTRQHIEFEQKIKLINPNIDVLFYDKNILKSKMYCNLHKIEFEIGHKQCLYNFYSCPECKTHKTLKGEEKDILKQKLSHINFVGKKVELKEIEKHIDESISHNTFEKKIKELNPNIVVIKYLIRDDKVTLYCNLHKIEFEINKHQIRLRYSCPLCKTQVIYDK